MNDDREEIYLHAGVQSGRSDGQIAGKVRRGQHEGNHSRDTLFRFDPWMGTSCLWRPVFILFPCGLDLPPAFIIFILIVYL